MEKSKVMLMLIPSARQRRIAGTPAAVPGIFTITFGRSTDFHSRRASAIVASVSFAEPGEHSIDTKPSLPTRSWRARKTSHAVRTSSTITASAISAGRLPRWARMSLS